MSRVPWYILRSASQGAYPGRCRKPNLAGIIVRELQPCQAPYAIPKEHLHMSGKPPLLLRGVVDCSFCWHDLWSACSVKRRIANTSACVPPSLRERSATPTADAPPTSGILSRGCHSRASAKSSQLLSPSSSKLLSTSAHYPAPLVKAEGHDRRSCWWLATT